MGKPGRTRSELAGKKPTQQKEDSSDSEVDDELLNSLAEGLEKMTGKIEEKLKKDHPNMVEFTKNPLKCIFTMLVSINDNIERQNEKLNCLNTRVDHLEVKIELLENRDKEITKKIDRLEIAERQTKAVITCTNLDPASVNLYDETRNLLTKELGLNEECTKTVRVNRLGRDAKGLLLTFPCIEAKIETYRRITNRRKNPPPNGRQTPIYMNDFLTEKNAKLFKDLRRLKEDTNKIYSVFSYNGNVCVKLRKEDRMITIYDLDQCKQLL